MNKPVPQEDDAAIILNTDIELAEKIQLIFKSHNIEAQQITLAMICRKNPAKCDCEDNLICTTKNYPIHQLTPESVIITGALLIDEGKRLIKISEEYIDERPSLNETLQQVRKNESKSV